MNWDMKIKNEVIFYGLVHLRKVEKTLFYFKKETIFWGDFNKSYKNITISLNPIRKFSCKIYM